MTVDCLDFLFRVSIRYPVYQYSQDMFPKGHETKVYSFEHYLQKQDFILTKFQQRES